MRCGDCSNQKKELTSSDYEFIRKQREKEVNQVTAIGEILWDVYPDQKRLGGAPFNFIYHIWKILGKANFISSVGKDEKGREIISYLNSIGFNTSNIYIDSEHPTGTVKVTLEEDRTPKFTISHECSYDYITLNSTTENLIENETDILYFGTLSTRSEISRNTIQSLFEKKHIKYFCDLNLRHDFYTRELIEQSLQTSNVIKINETELEKLKQLFTLENSNDLAIEQLFNKFGIELIGLTLGEDGAVLYNKSESHRCKSEVINVIDTLGAGDAYSAILAIGYLKKMDINNINRLANDFAYEICKIDGAIPIDDAIYEKYRNIF